MIYGVGFVLSFPIVFGSIFVFDGSDLMVLRCGIFGSVVLWLITIIVAMLLSRKSLRWYLLPLIPIVSLSCFGSLLGRYM